MRKLLITLFVLAVLLVGADIAGRAIAESKAGEAIATRTAVTPAPTVTVHGWSFLWQLVRTHFDHLTVSTADLTAGELSGVGLSMELYDVQMPFSDALAGRLDNLTAGRADVRAAIPVTSIARLVDRPGLTLANGDDGALRVTATMAIAGQTFTASADVTTAISGNALHLKATKLVAGPGGLPVAVSTQLLKGLSLTVPLSGLPFQLRDSAVSVQDGRLVLTGSATDVAIPALLRAGR